MLCGVRPLLIPNGYGGKLLQLLIQVTNEIPMNTFVGPFLGVKHFPRLSQCHLHHFQRWCNIFRSGEICVMNMRCFVLNYQFCPIFAFFLCKSIRKSRAKYIFKFCQCIYSVFLGYFIEIVCFSIYL